ncbi:MAG: hypothetical protein U0Q16_18230 [Bryobacteraceae bacterium]
MTYYPLGPKRRTLGGSSRLWLAPDHLLVVSTHLVTEKYRRFRFEDIQALVITHRPSRAVIQYALLFLALSFFIGFLFRVQSAGGRVALTILFAPILAALFTDIVRGPRCRCTLVTAVSSLDLPSVSRVRVAEKVVGDLAPVIEAAQPPMPADARIAPPRASAQPPEIPPPKQNRWLFALLFAASLFGTGISALGFWYRLPDSVVWLPWYVAALLIVLGGYLVHHYREEVWMPLRIVTLVSALLALGTLGASIAALVHGLSGARPSDPAAAGPMFQTAPDWFIHFARIANPVHGAVAAVGLALAVIALRKERQ